MLYLFSFLLSFSVLAEPLFEYEAAIEYTYEKKCGESLFPKYSAYVDDLDSQSFKITHPSEKFKCETYYYGPKSLKSSNICQKIANDRGDKRTFVLDEASFELYMEYRYQNREGRRVKSVEKAVCRTSGDRGPTDTDNYFNFHEKWYSSRYVDFPKIMNKHYSGICISLDGSTQAASYAIRKKADSEKNQYQYSMKMVPASSSQIFDELMLEDVEKDSSRVWVEGSFHGNYQNEPGYLNSKNAQNPAFVTAQLAYGDRSVLTQYHFKDYLEFFRVNDHGEANKLAICQLAEVLPKIPEGYTGDVLNRRRHGIGTQVYPNGDRYEGSWENNLRHGNGSYFYVDGTTYVGQYKDDKKHGTGTTKWKAGEVYVGEYSNDMLNGLGIFSWTDGNVYEGQFVDNERTGEGILKWADGSVYTGDFLKGKLHGWGLVKWINGDSFEGQFVENLRTGPGLYKWKNGEKFDGEFLEGLRVGYGVHTFVDGSSYKGNWLKNQRSGKGAFYGTDGSRFDGIWKEDKRDGNGILTLPDGSMFDQVWSNDALISSAPKIEDPIATIAIIDTALDFLHDKMYKNISINAKEWKHHNLGEEMYGYFDEECPDGTYVCRWTTYTDLLDSLDWMYGDDEDYEYDGDGNGYYSDLYGYNFVASDHRGAERPSFEITSSVWSEIVNCEALVIKRYQGTLLSSEEAAYAKCIQSDSSYKKFGGHSHGSHVGGIVLSRSPKSRLVGLTALPGNGSGSMADIEAAIGYLATNKTVIANGSFGEFLEGYDVTRIQTFEKILAKVPDTFFVFAAGNKKTNLNDEEITALPAMTRLDWAISVAAVNSAGELASFSNYGDKYVDVAAPGVLIKSTALENKSYVMSGTSQAAPYVSGIAAAMYEVCPAKFTPPVAKRILIETSDRKSWLVGKVKSGGIVNQVRAVTAMREFCKNNKSNLSVKKRLDLVLAKLVSPMDYNVPAPSPVIEDLFISDEFTFFKE